MPITFELQENGTVLYWKIEDPWKIGGLLIYYKQTETIFNNSSHMVHSLVDVRHARRVPAGTLSARFATTWHHPRSGQTAVIGASPLIKAMIETIFQLVHFDRVHFFDSEAEARSYLLGLIAQEA